MTDTGDLTDRWKRAALKAEAEADIAQAKLARIRAAIEQHQRLNPGPGTDMLLRKVKTILEGEARS